MDSAKITYLTRLGDNALILSHRLSEWCGKGPALEEDIALANVALDLLGQARLWLSYAGEAEGTGRDEDALAYFRGEREFFNLLLVEQRDSNYAETLVRLFYFDAWHSLALEALAKSSDQRVAEIAAKAQKEVAYHLRRSADLMVRLGNGTEQSRSMMQEAADWLWPYTGELFMSDEVDAAMAAQRIGFDPTCLRDAWFDYVTKVFEMASLQLSSPDAWMHRGGKQGIHSEHLGYLLAEMQSLPRSCPSAQW